ncbi:MAG TPA: substrate-binding domain-containing protein [Chthoniobacteraceae bacterium]|nr:substrate-binding domain-containing protein [Chthoniobacteraceae bacterium]
MSQKPLSGLRPFERVRNYILDPDHDIAGKGGRLPTMRDLAGRLGVSLATVQNVYRALKEEGAITTRVGDGAYLSPALLRKAKGGDLRLFCNRPQPMVDRSHSLQSGYYGALMETLMHGRHTFDFSVLDDRSDPTEKARALFRDGELDALLIFPFSPCQPLIDACDEEKIPYATIHPANAAASANFVTPDYFDAGYQIGKAAHAVGHQKIVFFSYDRPITSSTGWALLGGMTNGLLEEKATVSLERVPLNFEKRDEEVTASWLKEHRRNLPQLIVCHRFNSYRFVLEALAKMNVSVPGEVSVISRDADEKQAAAAGVTRLAIPYETVCRTAIDLIVRRIAMKGEPLPGIRVPLAFTGGATTSPEFNRQLGLR